MTPLSFCYDRQRDCLYVLDPIISEGGAVLRIALGDKDGAAKASLSTLLTRGDGDRFVRSSSISALVRRTANTPNVSPRTIAVSPDGKFLFIGDIWKEKNVVWRIALD